MEQEYDTNVHQARIFTLLAILLILATTGGLIKNLKIWISGEANGEPTPLPVISRIFYTSPNELQSLCRDVEVWEIHENEGYIIARLPHEKMDDVVEHGFKVEPAIDPTPAATPCGP